MNRQKLTPTPAGNYSEVEQAAMLEFAKEEISLTADDLAWEAGFGGPIPPEFEAWITYKKVITYYAETEPFTMSEY